jgi:mycothiol system anti-sigma-R factor
MSCGNPHEIDCSKILQKVFVYLDGEAGPRDCAEIRQHLDECGPCLQRFGLERMVKALVARSCGHDPVPSDLRAKVMMRIKQVQVEITPFD